MQKTLRSMLATTASILTAAGLTVAAPMAQAEVYDISNRLQGLNCQIPSDDQHGVARLIINNTNGYRSLSLALQYSEDAQWKMTTFPLQLVTFDDATGTTTLQVQYKHGYEGAAVINRDMSGTFDMKSPGKRLSIPMTGCQIALQ